LRTRGNAQERWRNTSFASHRNWHEDCNFALASILDWNADMRAMRQHWENTMRAVSSWLMLLLLSGCATPARLIAPPSDTAGEPPILHSAHGALSAERSEAILKEIAKQSGDSSMLVRHIRVEEALSRFPLTIGNQVTLLRDGPATYRSMNEAIRQAKDHINLETYIFRDDEIGRQLAQLLIARQRAGVQVNVMYDSVGSILTPASLFQEMQEAGINVLEFNPVNPAETRRRYILEHRDHRKLLIVDGLIGFTGGINYDSVYSGGSFSRPKRVNEPGKLPWRDTHVRIEGPAVVELQKLFIENWRKQNGEPLAPRRYFPQLNEPDHQIVRVIGSSPDMGVSVMHTTLLSAINHAERSVHITNAYFVPDKRLLEALQAAVKRGVEVSIILPGQSDFWAPLYAGRSHYSQLLKGGVRIYEFSEAMLHAKTVVIDSVWSTVGSSNLDPRSAQLNDEADAVILGFDFGQQMEAMFKDDIAHSKQITLQEWGHRGLGSRLKEMGARVWERWL
jgi:cardiolipin synthase